MVWDIQFTYTSTGSLKTDVVLLKLEARDHDVTVHGWAEAGGTGRNMVGNCGTTEIT